MHATVRQVTSGERHVVLDGTIDVVATGEDFRSIGHCLHIRSKLSDSLRCLTESQSEISEVVDVCLEKLARKR